MSLLRPTASPTARPLGRPADRSSGRPTGVDAARAGGRTGTPTDVARRWRRIGLIGSVLVAVAATGVGARPVTDEIGTWPNLFLPHPHAWPAMIISYFGLALLAGAWWHLGRAVRILPDRLSFVLRTGALWALPLAVAPPLYSRDVYSYLAQGALYASGLDPYQVGPSTLGGPLASNVSAIWQNTTAPYGPVFLGVASGVNHVSGQHLVLGILLMRVVMIGSLAVTAACMVPLARRFGADPANAVWLGVLNPLTLAHVVSGAHNDSLMIMLMVAGLLLAVRGRPLVAAVVLGLAVLVKLPAAAAIVVVVPAMARRLTGRYRMLRGALLVGGVSLVTVLAVTSLMGTWYGWVSALSDTAKVRNGLSISTDLGMLADGAAWLLGSGSFDAVTFFRTLGVGVAGLLTVLVLSRTRGRPVYALALIMFAVVLLGPVVHPWYLLWGIIPLAVSTRDPRVVRRVAVMVIAVAVYPMPWGGTLGPQAVWGAVGLLLGLAVVSAVRNPQHAWEPIDREAGALTAPSLQVR